MEIPSQSTISALALTHFASINIFFIFKKKS